MAKLLRNRRTGQLCRVNSISKVTIFEPHTRKHYEVSTMDLDGGKAGRCGVLDACVEAALGVPGWRAR